MSVFSCVGASTGKKKNTASPSQPPYIAGALPQPGPIFQALPEPLPLPPLPQPERPAEAMTPGMAPETAPAGLPQPGTSFQVGSWDFPWSTGQRWHARIKLVLLDDGAIDSLVRAL